MKMHGISTTGADFWAHLFPAELCIYWYSVRHMREHIAEKKPSEKVAHSKDGTKTGAGYLVLKKEPFIERVPVPKNMINAFEWDEGTDRQIGLLWGEKVLDWMIGTTRLRIPYFTVHKLNTKKSQYELGDFGIQFAMPRVVIVEVKTENVRSANLFVQTRERGHRVHQKRSEGEVVTECHRAPELT
jgi:hypothetical protein